MIKTVKPKSLDGAKLKLELLEVGIDLGIDSNGEPNKPLVDENGDLWLDINKSQLVLANTIISQHSA